MKRHLVLLLVAVLVGTVSAQLVYECYPNDTIVVTNPMTEHYIGAYANNSNGRCTVTWAGDYSTLTITDCAKSEDILLQISNRSQTDTILGGSGIYLTIVRCDEIDITGVPRSIVAGFTPTLLPTTEGAITPSFTVSSIFTIGGTSGAGHGDGALITAADVGTAVNWVLQIPDDYFAKLVQCTAYSGTSNTGTPSQQLIVDGCTQDSSILDSFATTKSAVVGETKYYYTTLYAFRFYNDDDIYLFCDVKICPSTGGANCLMDCSKRRRREVSTEAEEVEDNMSMFTHTGTSLTILSGNGNSLYSSFGLMTLALSLLTSFAT